MNKNQLIRAQNVVSETVGSLTKRKGYSQIGAQITASQDILMNTEYQYGTSPTREHIVVCDGASNSEIYSNDSGTWTSQSQSLTAGAKARATDFVDYLFFVNYSDATRSFDGTTWSTTTQVDGAPKAKFVESYRDRIYLAYCDVSGTEYPSRVYYSSLPDNSNTITWDTTNDWFFVETNDGDNLTGLAKNKTYLIIFKENSMFRYDGTQNATNLRPISWELGAVSQESIVVSENTIFAMSNKGVTMFTGSTPQIISRAIQPIIDRINWSNKADICAGLWGDHYLCYIGTLTSALPGDASALTNVIIDYDFTQNQWHYHTVPDTVKVFGNIESSGEKVLTFGDANGEVFTWDSGTTDDGTGIDTNVELLLWPSGPETFNDFQSIYFFGNSSLGDVDFGFKVDGGSYSTDVDLDNTYSHKYFADSSIDPFGRELGIKLSEEGGTNQWRLDGISIELEPGTVDVAT